MGAALVVFAAMDTGPRNLVVSPTEAQAFCAQRKPVDAKGLAAALCAQGWQFQHEGLDVLRAIDAMSRFLALNGTQTTWEAALTLSTAADTNPKDWVITPSEGQVLCAWVDVLSKPV